MSTYSLYGKIVDNNRKPKKGLKIYAYDDDPLLNPDDLLGDSATDSEGFFEISFDESRFKKYWEFLEGTPDIFLVIKDRNEKEVLKTRIKQTKKEIEYHIKLDDHKPDSDALNIYADNFRRIMNMLGDVGLMVNLENSINLDVLANGNLPDEIRKRFEEFRNGFGERQSNFNNMMAMLSGLVNSFLEERNLGFINYDGPQVPRLPRREKYNQVIIWPRRE